MTAFYIKGVKWMFPYFEVFGRTIGSYAVCSILGFIVAVFVATKLSKSFGMDFTDVILTFVVIAVGILVGGHLLYAITNLDSIVKYIAILIEKYKSGDLVFKQIIFVLSQSFGGSVFYGGLIGALISLIIYSKCKKQPLKKEFFDVFAVCIPLFHFFGRIGCFLGGCCYGIESNFGFIANNSLLPEMSGVRRFPIALVESGFNLLLFVFLLCLYRRKLFHKKLIFVYMTLYPIGRFVFEFFRGDEIRGIFFGLSTSQWISIIMFLIAIVHLIIKNKKCIIIT